MASFTERLKIILDVDTPGTTGLKKFGQEVRSADGVVGKFKAGATDAMGQVKQHVAAFAATAGAALLTFAVKAVGAFTDTAKAAIDLANATGLSVEQASRWIAVGDDYGVTAETLATAMGRIGKELDSDKWEKYGIATRSASGEARSANTVFLDVLETLNNTAPAERARVGAELLGRGWQGVAPILGKTRKEYEAMLAGVEDGQVITSSEAKKAEKWRLTMDKLQDALRDVTLAVGEQVAELAPYVEYLAKAVDLMAKLRPSADFGKVGDQMRDLAAAAEDSGDAIGYLVEKGYSIKAAEQLMADYRAEVEAAKEPHDALTDAAEKAEQAQIGLANAAKKSKEMIEDQREAIDDAVESMYDLEKATMSTDDAYAGYLTALEEATEAGKDAKLTDEERADIMRDLRERQIDVAEGVLKQAQEFAKAQGAADGSNASYMLQIGYLKDMKTKYPELAAEIQRYIDKLNKIPGVKTTNVTVTYGGQYSIGKPGQVTWRASGGRYSKGQLVGTDENGPEVEFKDSGGYVMNAGDTKKLIDGMNRRDEGDGLAGVGAFIRPRPSSGSGGAAVVINVNVAPGGNLVEAGRQMTDALRAYVDSGGVMP